MGELLNNKSPFDSNGLIKLLTDLNKNITRLSEAMEIRNSIDLKRQAYFESKGLPKKESPSRMIKIKSKKEYSTWENM